MNVVVGNNKYPQSKTLQTPKITAGRLMGMFAELQHQDLAVQTSNRLSKLKTITEIKLKYKIARIPCTILQQGKSCSVQVCSGICQPLVS